MAQGAMWKCRAPGCTVRMAKPGLCPQHERQRRAAVDAKRGTSTERGYDYRWRKLRGVYLREHPLCEPCQRAGRVVAATVVDHRTPHKGDPALLYDWDNLEAMCATCHNRKTASRDGGFGNPIL